MIRRTAVLSLALLSVVGLDACRRKVVQAPAPVAAGNDAQRQADSLAALRAKQRDIRTSPDGLDSPKALQAAPAQQAARP